MRMRFQIILAGIEGVYPTKWMTVKDLEEVHFKNEVHRNYMANGNACTFLLEAGGMVTIGPEAMRRAVILTIVEESPTVTD